MSPFPKLVFLAVAIISLLASVNCFAQRVHISELWYNGKRHNSLIVDRIPDYGDGRPDGCVIMGEMKLALRDTDQQTVEGLVKDVDNGKPVLSEVWMLRKDGSSDTFKTDMQGRFVFTRSSPVKKLRVRSIAYRPLQVEASGRKLF
jgi:hypothetical protein